LRALHLQGAVGIVRRRASLEFARIFHTELARPLGSLAMAVCDEQPDLRFVINNITEFCTGCRFLMCKLLEIEDNQLHVCMKVLVRGETEENDSVRTLARSEPLDGRAIKEGVIHRVGNNSVWSALLGKSDGVHHWRPFNCFSCDDLLKRPEEFRCSREQWQQYYRSVLVFPLECLDREDTGQFDVFGFLAFDAGRPGAFARLPDIFEHKTNWGVYHDKLIKRTTFHFGAAAASILSTALRPLYEKTIGAQTDATTRRKPALLE
jgi:hypothetical protein